MLLPVAVARLVDGIVARLFAAGGEGIAVHPVTVEGHRQGEVGNRAGMRLPVRPLQDPGRVLDPARAGTERPPPF